MENNITVLLDKARENHSVAEKAKESGFYHASISRYYYSIFEVMSYVVQIENPEYVTANGKDSHINMFNEFRSIAMRQEMDLFSLKSLLNDFRQLKRCRIEADYSTRVFDSEKFNREFYPFYESFNRTVNKVKNRIGGESDGNQNGRRD